MVRRHPAGGAWTPETTVQGQAKLDETTQRILGDAGRIAVSLGHPKTEPEHILMAMLRIQRVMAVLMAASGGVSAATRLHGLASGRLKETAVTASLPPDTVPLQSLRTKSLLSLATSFLPTYRDTVGIDDVLMALASATSSTAELFERVGLAKHQVIQAIEEVRATSQTLPPRSNTLRPFFFAGPQDAPIVEALMRMRRLNYQEEPSSIPSPFTETEDDVAAEVKTREKETGNCLTDMLAAARAGRYDALVARDAEVERVIQVLARRRKNNPILVGEPGVGKTAIAEGLALRILNGDVPPRLQKARLFSLNVGAMVAGTHYRGDFEARMQVVLEIAAKHKDMVLFIDEMHTVVGAGSASGQAMDAATLMKPALASGDVRVLGATTFEEYRKVLSKDRATLRRFQKVDVRELSVAEATKVASTVLPSIESHHAVTFAEGAVAAAVALSNRHLPDRRLPDKAIDVLDEAAARQAVNGASTVSLEDIEKIVSSMSGVPVGTVAAGDRELVRSAEGALRAAIFGQDAALARLAAVLKVSRAGLRRPDRPLASLLLAGPTGVGKTETARELARHMGVPLLRFDMSEFSESHSVSKLIGAVPGYVGYDQGGRLTEEVIQHPYSVVLLDEIEKAHPAIYNLLLQVMDAGRLTDALGKQVDFSNVILLMTTNAGGQALTRRSIGFIEQPAQPKVMQELAQAFSPEFRNRLDAVIAFGPLDRAAVLSVVDKGIARLADYAAAAGVHVEVSPATRDWLADRGFDPEMGARPLARVIEEHLQVPLADAILSASQPTRVAFDLLDGTIVMRSEEPVGTQALPPPVGAGADA